MFVSERLGYYIHCNASVPLLYSGAYTHKTLHVLFAYTVLFIFRASRTAAESAPSLAPTHVGVDAGILGYEGVPVAVRGVAHCRKVASWFFYVAIFQ